MKTIGTGKRSFALFFTILLAGCSFNPDIDQDISKPIETEYNNASVREKLALLKAGGNFTLGEENLTNWVTMMLNSETDGRNATGEKTVITGSRKLPVSGQGIANRSAYARSAAVDEPPVDVYIFDTESTGGESGGYVIASNDLRVGILLAIINNGSMEDEPELFTDTVLAGIANHIDYTIDVYNSISGKQYYWRCGMVRWQPIRTHGASATTAPMRWEASPLTVWDCTT